MASEFHIIVALGTFCAVILLIALDLVHMTVAALLGVTVLALTGILSGTVALRAWEAGRSTVALLFGGMIVARVLAPTGVFDFIGGRFLRYAGGSGKRVLLGIICLVAPICAFLPNATVILLLAPVLIRVARALDIDFVPLLILAAVTSNAAGLLTLVGDPATFIVGSSIHLSFTGYLQHVSLGGALSVIVIVPFLPWLFAEIWQTRRPLPPDLPDAVIERPAFAIAALTVLAIMIFLFALGDISLGLDPPKVAILGAALALLAVYWWEVEPIANVIRDIDWKTLIFILSMFLIVEGLISTGMMNSLAQDLANRFDGDLPAAALLLLFGVGALSAVLENIPVVIVMVAVVQGYMMLIGAAPEGTAAQPYLHPWPASSLPIFVAMMFGATLGGNSTVIGAAANVVASGVADENGRELNFFHFARYGVPIALAQLAVGSVYTVALYLLLK